MQCVVITIRPLSYDKNKPYPQLFLDEYLCKLGE